MRRSLFVIAMTTLLVLGACSESNDEAPSANEGTTTTEASKGTGSESKAGSDEGDRPPEKVIASMGDPKAEGGGIEITSLRREGDLATLRFTLVNNGAKSASVANRFGGVGSRSFSGVYLIDPAAKKKYLTVQDAAGDCVCTTNLFDVDPGERLEAFATFAAPPPNVEKVTVVIPSFQPADNVAITG